MTNETKRLNDEELASTERRAHDAGDDSVLALVAEVRSLRALTSTPTPEDVARAYDVVRYELDVGVAPADQCGPVWAALARLRGWASREKGLKEQVASLTGENVKVSAELLTERDAHLRTMGDFKRAESERDAARNALASANEQLQMTHAQVAEVARLLDPEVTPDAWGLHAAAKKRMDELAAARQEVDAAWNALAVPVRGMVPLAEVVADIKAKRDEAMKAAAEMKRGFESAAEALSEVLDEDPTAPGGFVADASGHVLRCSPDLPARWKALRERVATLERERDILAGSLEGVKLVNADWRARAEAAERRGSDTEPRLQRYREAGVRAAAELRHAYRAKVDWNLVARAIQLLERADHSHGGKTADVSRIDWTPDGRLVRTNLSTPPPAPAGLLEAVGTLLVLHDLSNAKAHTQREWFAAWGTLRAAYDAAKSTPSVPLTTLAAVVEDIAGTENIEPCAPGTATAEAHDAGWPAGAREVLRRVSSGPVPEHPDTVALRVLQARLNTPETKDFMEGVKLESAHQQERWGAEHDAGKADADWFWLLGFLAGKAIRPGSTPEKKRHHIIATAAVCLNWFRHVITDHGDMRLGIAPPDGLSLDAPRETARHAPDCSFDAHPGQSCAEAKSEAAPRPARTSGMGVGGMEAMIEAENRRPARMTPPHTPPPLEPTSLREPSTVEGNLKPDSNSGPEVVWEGDGVRVEQSWSGVTVGSSVSLSSHTIIHILARALAEAKREVRKAAEDMRERAAEHVERSSIPIAIEYWRGTKKELTAEFARKMAARLRALPLPGDSDAR